MARIRSIHPNACQSDKLAQASDGAERCYWRLQVHCDDDGRAEDHPRLLAGLMFVLNDDITGDTVDLWLTELADLGLIVRYESGGKRYLAVVQWHSYQRPQKKKPSDLPAPPSPGSSRSGTRPARDEEATATARRGVEGSGDVTGGEGEREGEPLPIGPTADVYRMDNQTREDGLTHLASVRAAHRFTQRGEAS